MAHRKKRCVPMGRLQYRIPEDTLVCQVRSHHASGMARSAAYWQSYLSRSHALLPQGEMLTSPHTLVCSLGSYKGKRSAASAGSGTALPHLGIRDSTLSHAELHPVPRDCGRDWHSLQKSTWPLLPQRCSPAKKTSLSLPLMTYELLHHRGQGKGTPSGEPDILNGDLVLKDSYLPMGVVLCD